MLTKQIRKLLPYILLIYIAVVSLLSLISMPQTAEIELPNFLDKIVHFCFYFGMSILLLTIWWIQKKRVRAIDCVKVFFISFTYGVAIEIIQPHLGRTFDIDDIIANTIGNIAGILLILSISRLPFKLIIPCKHER